MKDDELQRHLNQMMRNYAVSNVKALNIDVPVLRALVAKIESLEGDVEQLDIAARNVVAQFNDPHVSLASVARYVNELETAIVSTKHYSNVERPWP